jgi:hypothetical protein
MRFGIILHKILALRIQGMCRNDCIRIELVAVVESLLTTDSLIILVDKIRFLILRTKMQVLQPFFQAPE